MENRPDLYFAGNTVIPPHPGAKRKRQTMQLEGFLQLNKMMPFQRKICATSACVWCDRYFGGQYMVVCPQCRNCQYCGLLVPTSIGSCEHCGNYLPRVLKVGGQRFIA